MDEKPRCQCQWYDGSMDCNRPMTGEDMYCDECRRDCPHEYIKEYIEEYERKIKQWHMQ